MKFPRINFRKKKKENEMDGNEHFYRAEKVKKRMKRKSYIKRFVSFFLIAVAIISILNLSKQTEVAENSSGKQFVITFIEKFYSYPTTEADRTLLSELTTIAPPTFIGVEYVSVKRVDIKAIDSEISNNTITTSFSLLIYLEIGYGVNEDGAYISESSTIERNVTIIELENRTQFGIISVTSIKNTDQVIRDTTKYSHEPTVTTYILDTDQRQSAESRVVMFLNQYNDSYVKALDLVENSSVIDEKADDVIYEFESLINATSNKEGSVWYIQANIRIVNGDFIEYRRLEIHFNTNTGRIEKMEVY